MTKKIFLYIALLLLSASSANAATVTLTLNSNIDYACGGCSELTFTDNTDAVVYIYPAAGYMVDAVVVDSSSIGSVTSYTFVNITGTHSLSATAVTASYNVSASAGAHGSINPSGTQGPYVPTDSPNFVITPDSGYQVANVLLNGVSIGPSTKYSFEKYGLNRIRTTHTIAATFEAYSARSTASVMLKWDYNVFYGDYDKPTGYKLYYGKSRIDQAVHHGNQTFTLTPAASYQVADVLVDGSSVGAVQTYTFTNVTADHTISATFEAETTNDITPSTGANGAISPSVATSVLGHGSQTFSIIPDSGYQVADVLKDGSSIGAVETYTFVNVTAAHTISATFTAETTNAITPSAGANGAIAPAVATSVRGHGSLTFAIIPDSGYQVANVLVDGSSVGAVYIFTFTDVTAAHTISATFEAETTNTITPSTGDNGAISPSVATSVAGHGSQTFAITPNENYKVANVLVDGSSVGAVQTYTFVNVTAAHTISATFSAATYHTITPTAGANGTLVAQDAVMADVYSVDVGYANQFCLTNIALADPVFFAVKAYKTDSAVTQWSPFSSVLTCYLLTPEIPGAGSISPDVPTVISDDMSQAFTISPASSTLLDVMVDGASKGALTTLTIDNPKQNHTITPVIGNLVIGAGHQIGAASGGSRR